MKTNSKKSKGNGIIFEKLLKGIPFKKLSKQSGFCKRKPKKIGPKNIIISFLLSIWSSKTNSYNNWASHLGLLINATVSKQAISKRVTGELVEYLRNVLKAIMKTSDSLKKTEKVSEKLKDFKRIIIEDSTTIHLNDKLSKEYPGSKNHLGRDFATMKIQVAYEVVTKTFLSFGITNFRANDQSYAPEILNILKRGDLIIRDLGYFVTGIFKKLNQNGVSFVSRLRKGVNLYLAEEEKPIDLAKMLKKRGNLDIDVFMGQQDKAHVRLIAIPVDEQTASERRRKARIRKDHGNSIRKENLFLLGWNLLITNIPKEKMDGIEVAKLYSLRWRIEIIFKCWKSSLGMKNVPNDANKIRLEAFIYCMLILIMLFQVHYYIYSSSKDFLNKSIPGKTRQISLLKLMKFLVSNIYLNIYAGYLKTKSSVNLLQKQIEYYCSYELRSDRINYAQLLQH